MAKKKPAAEAVVPATGTTSQATTPEATEYTVLARRYRPQQFADLVGQEPVAQSLINAIQSKRVAHAYLFTGARGVGKTSTARILAKCLNCEKGPTPTPCDQCENCLAVSSGEDTDVLEIDGASNNGVENVRELRANVNLRPSHGRYKIYIIDEVHMLSGAAFNALLKTLEEPPEHVKFIFATTEVTKIPITILSRCQRFDFAGIGMKGIVDRLKAIVASESMKADDDALELIARRAGGSMRDAQSLLDQLLAFGDDKLTAEQVHRLLGTANEERVAAIAGAALEHDAPKALALLGEAADQGVQLGEFMDQLMEYWRDLMIVQCAGVENPSLSVTAGQKAALKQQADQLTPETILAGLDVLVGAKNKMRFTSHARVLFEMALVRLCRLENLVPLSQLAQWVSGKGDVAVSVASPRGIASQGSTPAATVEKKKVDSDESPQATIPLRQESLEVIWQQVLSQAGLVVSSELKKASGVAISGPNALVLLFPARYNALSDSYLDNARLGKVAEVLTKIVGQPCSVRMEFAGAGPATNGVPKPEQANTIGAGAARTRKQRAEVAKVPLVGKAMEVLGGQVVQMDDDFGTESSMAARPESSDSTDEASSPEPGDPTEEG